MVVKRAWTPSSTYWGKEAKGTMGTLPSPGCSPWPGLPHSQLHGALHTCLITRVWIRWRLNMHTNYSWNPCYPGGGDIEVFQAHWSPRESSLHHRSPVQWPLQNALQLAVWLGRQALILYLYWGFRAIALFLFRMNFTSNKTIKDF